ncbi:MAG: rod shape-determining protein [Clostridia bacterium]|nr:rod shape-determining protein [Clostridia bacterium]
MGKKIGIDLGTANTLMYMGGKGIILRAPSVVAVESHSRKVVAVGGEAKRMIGKTPGSIIAYRPLKGGVIADFEVTSMMIHHFLRKIDAGGFFNRPSVIVCMPYGVTEVEKRAVEDATLEAGVKSVSLIEEPIAAAIGSGLRVSGSRGSMIVDIGGGTTEVAVVSLGGIVVSHSTKVAGDELDNAIIQYMREKYNVLIGEGTAEILKKRIGSVHPSVNRGALKVYGRNLRSGLGAELTVTSGEIREALSERVEQIIETIKDTLEDTPPELSADIYDFGIMMAGGGAMLGGLPLLISERTGIRVTVAKSPLESVCLGIGRVIESPGGIGSVLRQRTR